MEFLRTFLAQQPLLALFLTIAIGYLLGQIDVKGLSLGVGAVLFVALAMGWFAPRSAPPPLVGTLGLALFLYMVGIQYGREFFRGLTSASGLRSNFLALVGVSLSGVVCLLFVRAAGVAPTHSLGLFAGSGTSTPTLQAAIVAFGNDDAAVGYSIAYPFGVAGPIVFLYLAFAILKPKIAAPTGAGMELLEVALKRSEYFGRRLADLVATLPERVRVIALRRDGRNRPPAADAIVADGDALLLVGPTASVLDEAQQALGAAAPGSLTSDRRDLDYVRVFASRAAVVGRTLGDLELPGGHPSIVVQVRRGDAEIHPTPDVVLEHGDRVGLLANRADFAALRKYFGDSIKGTAEFSYVSIGIGMALGFLVGAIAIPVPGVGSISLGLSGVLIVALIAGKLRRAAGVSWTVPPSANLVLRNFGLTLFLAQVGMSSGPKFAATVSETGFGMLGMGAVVLAALVVPILVLGLFAFRLPYDEVAGIVAGACGNPAILVFTNKLAPTDAPDLAYATLFPAMTIAKILFVDVVASFY